VSIVGDDLIGCQKNNVRQNVVDILLQQSRKANCCALLLIVTRYDSAVVI